MGRDGTLPPVLTVDREQGTHLETAGLLEELDLSHQDASLGQSTKSSDEEASSKFDDEKTMQLAEWVYLNVEEVWSGFNLLAEATARGFEVRAVEGDQAVVDEWARRVDLEEKVRMWIKNALVYGRCVMESGPAYLKVRNPRSMELEQDDDGGLVEVKQVLDDGEHPVPVEDVHVFTLHRLFSDDVRGISACQPVLQTVDDMVGAREVNRAIQERYRAPVRIVEMPADATREDRQSVQSTLEETPPEMDLVLPPGASVTVIGHGDEAVEVDALMQNHLVDRIFIGLGIPKVALGIPQDSNRATSRTQRKLLLEQKVKPYQRQVRSFVRDLITDVLDVEVEVEFDPVSARDAEVVAQVSKILVEQGIKTPEEVEEEFWNWAEPNDDVDLEDEDLGGDAP